MVDRPHRAMPGLSKIIFLISKLVAPESSIKIRIKAVPLKYLLKRTPSRECGSEEEVEITLGSCKTVYRGNSKTGKTLWEIY